MSAFEKTNVNGFYEYKPRVWIRAKVKIKNE